MSRPFRTLRIFYRASYNTLLNEALSSVAVSMAGCPSKMSSFSIDSILALQETKCGTAQDNDIHKNINALSVEELRDEDVTTSKCGERRSSPSSSLTVGIEESSYEGKVLVIFYSAFHVFTEFVTYLQRYCIITVAEFVRLEDQDHSTLWVSV